MIIKSYGKVFKIEKKVRSVFDLRLPFAVTARQIGYFSIILVILMLINALTPIFNFLGWWLIRYIIFVAIAIGVTVVLNIFQMDGKNPVIYFWDYLVFFFTRKDKIYLFRVMKKENDILRLNWKCGTRTTV